MGFELSDIFNFLADIGFTKESTIPLIVVSLIAYILISKKFSAFSKKLYKSLKPIRNAIVEIQSILSNSGGNISHSLTEKVGSPLQATEYGMTLINESGLMKILEENKEKLLEELHNILIKSLPITPYDVQEKARELLINKKNDKLMAEVRTYAFENALTVETILRTGSLLLRNEYLKKHKVSKK